MKPQVKRFSQFVNEGDNPAHNLFRKMRSRKFAGDPGQVDDLYRDYDQLDPENTDRLSKLAVRTKDMRKNDANRSDVMAATEYYRSEPDRLRRLIESYFTKLNDPNVADMVEAFSNGEMSLEELAEDVVSMSPQQGLTADTVMSLLLRGR